MNTAQTIHRPKHVQRRGASATELAIILPLLVLVTLLCVDFGRFLYTDIAVANAVRAGAAYAIMHPEDTAPTRATFWARQEMAGQIGFEESNLTTVTTQTREIPTPQHPTNMYRVEVVGTYDSFVPVVPWPLLSDRLIIKRSVVMRMIR